MAKKSNKSTLTKVGEAIKKATKSVADTAEEYIVEPVSKALGTKGKKKTAKPAAKAAASKKTSTTPAAKTSAARKTTTKKAAGRKATGPGK